MAMIVKGSSNGGTALTNYSILNPLSGANLLEYIDDVGMYWYNFDNFNPQWAIIQWLPENGSNIEGNGSFINGQGSSSFGDSYLFNNWLSVYPHGELDFLRNILEEADIMAINEKFCVIFINNKNEILMDTFKIIV